MQSDQQAYDRGSTIFSPDGRLYQVEYAREAVNRGSAVVGVRTVEGAVFAADSSPRSPLVESGSIEKLHDLDGRLGVATAGHVADGRRLVEFAREYAQRERLRYGEAPGVEPVVNALADFVQESTQRGGTRPFGTALLVGGVGEEGSRLFGLDPSGAPTAWAATALGRDSDEARSHLEAEYEKRLSLDDGTALAVQALAESSGDGLSASEVDLATADADGFDVFEESRRAQALTDAGLT